MSQITQRRGIGDSRGTGRRARVLHTNNIRGVTDTGSPQPMFEKRQFLLCLPAYDLTLHSLGHVRQAICHPSTIHKGSSHPIIDLKRKNEGPCTVPQHVQCDDTAPPTGTSKATKVAFQEVACQVRGNLISWTANVQWQADHVVTFITDGASVLGCKGEALGRRHHMHEI